MSDNTAIVRLTKTFDTARLAGKFVDDFNNFIPGLTVGDMIVQSDLTEKWHVEVMAQGEIVESWEACDW